MGTRYKKAHISYDKGMLVVDTKANGNHDNVLVTYEGSLVTVVAEKRICADLFKFFYDDKGCQEFLLKNINSFEGDPIKTGTREKGFWLWEKKYTEEYLYCNNMHPLYKKRVSATYTSSNFIIIE